VQPTEFLLAQEAPSALAPVASSEGPVTFDALVATALAQSPDLALTAARVAQAEAGLGRARAAWWPTVGVDASFLRADAPSMYLFKTIDAGRFQGGTDFNAPGSFSNWEAGLGARMNLYNGGRDELGEAMAEDTRALALLGGDAVENGLVAALTDGWYSVRAAEEQIQTAEASIQTVAAQLSEARVRYEKGSGLRTDVLSLEVRLAQSEELLLRARNGRALGLAVLAQLAGLEQDTELDLAGAASVPSGFCASLDEAMALAETSRPELEQARRRVQQAERGGRMADSAYLPRADLFARGWRDSPDLDFGSSRDNWALGVSLSWDFLDGGQRGAGVDEARARLDEARRAEQKARLAVQLDVRTAWLRVTDAEARLQVARKASDTAEETLQLVRAQYEAGAATITRYLEAELMNTEARTRRTGASYDLERAGADLARAVGHYKGATSAH
jgi:outer membrane protein TolC